MDRFLRSETILSDIAVIGVEVAALVILFLLVYVLLGMISRRSGKIPFLHKHRDLLEMTQSFFRRFLLLMGLVLALAIVVSNGYLIYQKTDVLAYTLEKIDQIPPDFWTDLGISMAKILGLVILAAFIIRKIRPVLTKLQERLKAYEQLKANDESIEAFFSSLNRILRNGIWLLVLVVAAQLLPLPPSVSGLFLLVLRIYLIISIGLLLVKSMTAVVDSLDALSKKYWYRKEVLGWYDRLAGLVPLLRKCLEYIIYVSAASLVLMQLQAIAELAVYGPLLIQVIGIIFLARVAVELVNLLVDRSFSKQDDLSAAERQQKLTIVPIIKSLAKYVAYFAALVMVLYTLNINPTPLLAGAGILGIVVGLGAQALINDIVSGFFIIFENIFLVGDYIETGSARGVVESIEIRTTRIRNPDGQLHIMRNGTLGDIVNFSKEYTNAVVEVGVAYDSNLNDVYRVINEVGTKLDELYEDVFEPTEVQGLNSFGESDLLIRTVTKVKPGRHFSVARQMRKMLKEAFDREGIEIPFARRVLIFQNDEEGKETGRLVPPGESNTEEQ